MIFADKIIHLRKKCGWSQEELAEKMNVSRQSISKWEGAQSVPDLDKILKLCQVFGVSTDYLLKEEIEEPDIKEDVYEPMDVKHISVEFANEYMKKKKTAALRVAIGVVICILSPITLIVMGGYNESGNISETMAATVGLGVFFLMLIPAVILFIINGSIMGEYEWLEKETFALDYGVSGIVEDRMKKQKPSYTLAIAVGVGLCILGVAMFAMAGILYDESMITIWALGGLMFIVSIAVFLFVRFGNERDGYLQLLQLEDYDPERKKNFGKREMVGGIYWCSVTAIYLAVSFITNAWGYTWIIWPVTAVFFGGIMCIIEYTERKKDR